jgi:serine/threonine-protein kinase
VADELIAGRYTIQEELGRGASATVFKARDTLLDRSVALKVIASSLASDPEFTWRFEQEARLAARLDHPNIVTVHDVGTLPDGRAFIAMRLLEGKALDKLMAERGQLTPPEVINIVDQLASALDYTHVAGLVHRDVKPSNVTIDAAGRVTLTDFGIARALDSARVTLPGLTIGTPRYMSPEQVRGEDTTPATDEYSLAVMAYEMMAGRPPFEGDGTALMYKIVHDEPPAPNSFNPWLPVSVAEVIQKALSKNPGDRWASSGEFARQLKDALATSTGRSAALPGTPSGQTTIVSTPPTAVYSTGSSPVAPVSTGSGPAAAQSATGTGSQAAEEQERKKPTTIIPPVILPTTVAEAPAPEVAAPEPLASPVEPVTQVAQSPVGTGMATSAPASLGSAKSEAPPTSGTAKGAAARAASAGEPPARRTALLWGGIAALVVGGAALGAFLLLGGGDGEGRFEGDETPTNEAVASVDARVSPGSTPDARSPTSTTGPGTPTSTPAPSATSVVPTVLVTNPQGTAVVATATPTNTSVPPTNTSIPPTSTNTSVPPTPTNTSVPPTATNTTAAGFYVTITSIKYVNGEYHVSFNTNSLPSQSAADHVHFYYNTSPSAYVDYYQSGLFTGFNIWNRPSAATQICALSSDENHLRRAETASCATIPKEE